MREPSLLEANKKYLSNPKICRWCGKPIPLSKYGATVTKYKSFCNRSCSSSYNGHFHPKRKPKIIRKCQACGGDVVGIYRDRHNFRGSYYKPWHPECYKNITELANERPISSVNDKTTITCMARNYMKRIANSNFKCWVCGYSTIVEVCHVKAVASFPPETLVGAVNALDNLLLLCPNHHKELDRGLIKAADIKNPFSHPVLVA